MIVQQKEETTLIGSSFFLLLCMTKILKIAELDKRSKEYASNDYTNLRTNELFKFKFSNPFWSLYSINGLKFSMHYAVFPHKIDFKWHPQVENTFPL